MAGALETAAAVLSAEEPILAGLSAAQREAVGHGEGPLLIVAGAGTGKTTVLTRRIAYLIASKRARPEEILALTFTEKAALEMAERVDQLIPYGYAETWISTFHAFGDHVLREGALEAGLNPEFRVLTRPEQIIFLRERLWRLPLKRFLPLGEPTRHLSALLTLVSRAKDEDVSPAEYAAWAEKEAATATTEEGGDEADRHLELAAFYQACQALMAEAGLVDFGDQIHRTLALLRERPALLAKLRGRFRYVLVDEFQDTNHAQLELIRLLAGQGSPNITVVGDDDQAIYRWRGAAAANLLAFRSLFPGARQVVLRENYRSTQAILDAAGRLIAYNNPYRLEVVAGIDKRLRAERSAGRPVRHRHFDTVSAEADGVAAMVAEFLEEGRRPRDIALLVRSNGDADPFLPALNLRAIPHRFSGSRGLYAREEVRLLVCFLRALANPEDSVSLFYLAASELYALPPVDLLRLNRYATKKSRPLLEVLRGLPANEDLLGVGEEARQAAGRVLEDLGRAAGDVPNLRTGEVLYRFLQSSGLLARLSREATAEGETRVRNIARFFEGVKAYADLAEHDRVPNFVAHLDLLREAGDDPAVAEADPDEDAVHVLTVHKAKGLEFPVVFLVGCAEWRFPLRPRPGPLELPGALVKETLAGGDPHLQEERRLFYVAMTRAKDELVITSAADYGTSRPRKRSRFLVEALDLPSPAPAPRRTRATEALARHQRAPEATPDPGAAPREDEVLRLSFRQIDDYETCPLKYRYIHRLRVPVLAHHRVLFGSAVHKAVQEHFRARVEGRPFSADALVEAFRRVWVSEGFLSREHEERSLRAGEEMLRRFHAEEAADPLHPTGVEKDFAFYLEPEGGAPFWAKVAGRYDLVVEGAKGITILDFKTGAVGDQEKAQERARESLQLDIYALAHLRTTGRLPERVELRFLESGQRGGKTPTREEAAATEARIRASAALIRENAFPARPSYMACGQCPFREICPHTARGPEAEHDPSTATPELA
ncbi:MAG TPA: ATP-dependent DNA helicase [Vicinamibacteria bacterium]|nr:ATP-dependent DNA helicase [Vicinamibacteria bacterium]